MDDAKQQDQTLASSSVENRTSLVQPQNPLLTSLKNF